MGERVFSVRAVEQKSHQDERRRWKRSGGTEDRLIEYKDTVKSSLCVSLSLHCVSASRARLGISLTVLEEAGQGGSAVSQGYPRPAA